MTKRRKILLQIGILALLPGFGGWLMLPGTLPGDGSSSQHSLKLLDRNGVELRDIPSASGSRGRHLNLESVGPQLRDALIYSEDRRFYTHHGADWLAMARATKQNLRAGDKVSGASTITMQSARMAFGIGHGYWDKVRQILIALKLEHNHSKGRILEYYLNHVPFSRTIVGVAEACNYYFSSDCQRLTLAQSATLAVLVRAPNRLWGDMPTLLQRRDELLQRLARMGKVTDEAANLAIADPLNSDTHWADFLAPHFTERVYAEHGSPAGNTLHTTLDIALQRDTQALVKHHVESLARHKVNAAAVLVVDNSSGEVLAYVGSPDYFDEQNNGMVDYVQTRRQPGSAVKPFTYALAMQQGYTLATLLPDLPLVFSTEAGPYRPQNYDGSFSGPRRLRETLANSLNVPALYTAIDIGSEPLLQWYHQLGFDSLVEEADYYGAGLTLGNGELSLWELTHAYVMLARGGNTVSLSTLYSGSEGRRGRQLMDRRIAYLLSDVMRDPISREAEFGRNGPLDFKFPVAVKTGTSSDYRDNWVVGYSGELTVGVWVGNEQGTPLRSVSGVTGAGPLFHQVMVRAMQARSKRWQVRPDGLVDAAVCPLSGKVISPYCEGSFIETFREERVPTEPDDFYRRLIAHDCNGRDRTLTYVKLPPLYREWEHSLNLPTMENVLGNSCADSDPIVTFLSEPGSGQNSIARILEPKDGSFYAHDPHIPVDRQKMAVRLLIPEGATRIELQIDGLPADAETLSDSVLLWPMEKGEHTLRARFHTDGSEWIETEVVHIKVF